MASYYRDKRTGIGYQHGSCSLPKRGFKEVARLKKSYQPGYIHFYENEEGKVAISADYIVDSDYVFDNRKDGNRWYEFYIKKYHGGKIERITA